jgi:hypothetical protein
MVQAIAIMIVNYTRKTFAAQATGVKLKKLFWTKFTHSFL